MASFHPDSYAGAGDAEDSGDLRLLHECLFDEAFDDEYVPPPPAYDPSTSGCCSRQETPKALSADFIFHTRTRERARESQEAANGNDAVPLPSPRPTQHSTIALVLSPEESEMLLVALRDGASATSTEANGHNVRRGGSSGGVRETTTLSNAGTSMGVTNDSVNLMSSSARCSETEGLQELQAMIVRYRRQSGPNQQKQEVDLLRQKVKELEAEIEQLRLRRVSVQPSPDRPASNKSQKINMWEQIAAFERKAANLVVQENTRLRAQYTFQREIIQRLDESRSQSQLAFEAVCTFPDGDLLSGMGTPYDEDAAVFAALGRDFDVRFLQTKAIFDAVGLTGVNAEMQYVNRPRRSVKGILYFESLRSEIIPLEMHVVERIIQNCMKSTDPSLRDAFFSGKVFSTKSTIQTKTVHTIRVLEFEATLTLRSFYKRHVGEHKVVVLWERDIAFSGSVSVRFREKGWSVLRRPTPHTPNGAVSIEQAYSRLIPDTSSIRPTQSVDVETLRKQSARVYYEQIMLQRKTTEELLATHFDKLTRL